MLMIGSKSGCPYCEKVFTGGDDVVYCPECGTPHHRACWLEHGECANSAKHPEGFIWKNESPDPIKETASGEKREAEDQSDCPNCGAENPPNALICTECGMRLGSTPSGERFSYNTDFFMRGISESPDEDIGGITVKEAAMYTQNKASDYVKKFAKQNRSGKKTGWNWAAFLFSPLWFFYRKLYKAGLCFVALSLALSMFIAVPLSSEYDKALAQIEEFITLDENTTSEEFVSAIDALTQEQRTQIMQGMQGYVKWFAVSVAAQFALNAVTAVFADGLYRKKVLKDVASIREFARNQRTFEVVMLQKGGTSVVGMLAGYCIFFLLNNILLLF